MSLFLISVIISGTPLLLATLGELITEKSGHLNLGVEGMMLMGAVFGFAVGYSTNNPYLALLAAMIAGSLSAFIFGFLTITLRANHVVSGLALTIFGTGLSSYIGSFFVGHKMPQNIIEFFKPIKLPILSEIPFLGPILFHQDLLVYASFLLAITMGIYLHHTRLGLNLKAIGENPSAADGAGIPVSIYKYAHILIGGGLCGLGGAYLSIVQVPVWQDNITSGRGWIAIALVIFSKWSPYKAIYAAYLFGGLSIAGFRLQHLNVPQSLLDTMPYIFTIVVLVISSMKKTKENTAPKALSMPYFREER